jgi:hypothetical protein
MGRGLTHLISVKGFNSPACYSGRWLYTGVPFFETICSDGLACRLPVFLTKGGTLQNRNSNFRLHGGRGGAETSGAVTTS